MVKRGRKGVPRPCRRQGQSWRWKRARRTCSGLLWNFLQGVRQARTRWNARLLETYSNYLIAVSCPRIQKHLPEQRLKESEEWAEVGVKGEGGQELYVKHKLKGGEGKGGMCQKTTSYFDQIKFVILKRKPQKLEFETNKPKGERSQ